MKRLLLFLPFLVLCALGLMGKNISITIGETFTIDPWADSGLGGTCISTQ